MKKGLLFVLVVLMAIVVVPAFAEEGDTFAMLCSSQINDYSWNAAALKALEALQENGLKFTYAESVDAADAERIIRQYIDEGYKMILGHSFIFSDAIKDVAEEYPEVAFAISAGSGLGEDVPNNVSDIDYEQSFAEIAYPIGVVAGYVSKTGKIGAIYGLEIPVCTAMGDAFIAGAKSVNPDATLSAVSIGDFGDIAGAKEAALAQAEQGVDFWIECGEGMAAGAIEAAKATGGYATGYVSDMTDIDPEAVLISMTWNLQPWFSDMLTAVREGTYEKSFPKYGVAEGAMTFTLNEELAKDVVPAEALEAAEKVLESFRNGASVMDLLP